MRSYRVNLESHLFRILSGSFLQNLLTILNLCNICGMKAKQLILDLLRTYGSRGTSVQDITDAGALFGLTENSIRVNLSRLASKGAIETVRRGEYRWCGSRAAVNDFAESWRAGEDRMRAWDGSSWLCVHLLKVDQTSEWVLSNHGLRPITDALWIRPSNLNMETAVLTDRLTSMGLNESAIILDHAELREHHALSWLKHLNLKALEESYLDANQFLNESLNRLKTLPIETAKTESFRLGGRAIEIMAKDPLIPEQWLDPRSRRKLWQALLKYDAAGRQVWATKNNQAPDTLVTPNSKLMSLKA
jgi:phenylacetic acid degradation operon negative regulatory protein